MRKMLAFALLSLVLLPAVFAQIQNPQLALSANVTIDENGTVTATGGQMRGISINISVPLSSPYQKVETQSARRLDEEGNDYIVVSSSSPANPFHYSERITVSSIARSTDSLPDSYEVPPEAAQYLAQTSRTESGDPQIRALAQNITAGASDPFEKAARLAVWVNSNMAYDESMVGQENSALWALQNRRGVCVEYSTLFIALARASGLPARYVTGYVYSDQFGSWLGHAWAEVYLGKWVPVDPTWLEVGAADALHIEAGKYSELSDAPSLIASVVPSSTQLEWVTSGKSGAFSSNINTDGVQLSAPGSDYILKAAETTLAPGGSTIVFLSMNGTDYRVIEAELATCKGESSVSVEGGRKFLVLRPNQTATAAWVLHASSSLPSNYIYNCPLTLNSPVLTHGVISITVDPRAPSLPDYSASLEKPNAQPGEENSALLSLPAPRRGLRYYLVSPSGVQEKLAASPLERIPFVSSGSQAQEIYLAGEGGGYKLLEYQPGQQNGIFMDSLSLPQNLTAGGIGYATVNISSASYPADVDVEASFAGETERKSARIAGPSSFEFSLLPTDAGVQALTISVYSNGKLMDQQSAQLPVAAPQDAGQPSGTGSGNAQGAPSGSGAQGGAKPCPLALALIFFPLAAFVFKR
ncbi:Transglutaminase-like superfamily protein [uncultured archaeon]|nr:Transglutaminase-like superfamily protein [uncultured archaeon]